MAAIHETMEGLPDAPSAQVQSNGQTAMRIIGRHKDHPITFSASAVLLAEGARFNDEIHRLPTGNISHIRKGLYRFKTFAEFNQHQQDCLVEGMVKIALERM